MTDGVEFKRGNCGRRWTCINGIPTGQIVTMGDLIMEEMIRQDRIRGSTLCMQGKGKRKDQCREAM